MKSLETDTALLGRLFKQARCCWIHIGLILLVSLIGIPLALLAPVPLKIAVDSAVGADPLPRFVEIVIPKAAVDTPFRVLLFAALFQVFVVLLIQLNSSAKSVLKAWVGQRLLVEFRAALFSHVQRLSLSAHDSRGVGDSLYRVQADAQSIEGLAVSGFIPLFSSLLMLGGMLYVTIRIDPQLATVALIVCPALFVAGRFYRMRMRSQYKWMKESESSALKVVQEALGAVRIVKAFGREEGERDRFLERSNVTVRIRTRIAAAESLFDLFVNVLIGAGMALVLFIGIRNVQGGLLSIGELLVVYSYIGQLYGPLRDLSRQASKLQTHLASAHRVFEIFDELPEVDERPHATRLGRAEGDVEFRNVSFGYSSEKLILRHVSLRIGPGMRLGIVGRTGVGKTTLANLMMRFYDPLSGSIYLDGIDIRNYKLKDLRKQFTIVLQEPVLFSTTIAENIAYSKPGASEKEIIGAAKAAEAHNFIRRLPEGYDTPVGERGMRLSGGERQRISLARAFLKNAPILILDEPTSSVDIHTEAKIVAAMKRLMEGRTTFVIAHRESTLKGCDVWLRMDRTDLHRFSSKSNEVVSSNDGEDSDAVEAGP